MLWLGSEDGVEELTVPRLVACGANLANVFEIQGVVQQGKRNTFSMQDDLASVSSLLNEARASGRTISMLVINPITSYLPGHKLRKVELNDARQLRTVLEPWLMLPKQRSATLHGRTPRSFEPTHTGKPTSMQALNRRGNRSPLTCENGLSGHSGSFPTRPETTMQWNALPPLVRWPNCTGCTSLRRSI